LTKRRGSRFEGDLRRALLDAALHVLVERGASALSLRELARALGVSHAAPAYHFRDKAALLTAVASEGLELLTETMLDHKQRDDDPVTQLTGTGIGYVRFAETHRGHFEVMFRRDIVDVTDTAYVESSERAIGVLMDAVEACRASGWGRGEESWVLTVQAWAVMHGIASLHAHGSLARITGTHSPTDIAAAVGHALEAAFSPAHAGAPARNPSP
jgi:AcrR family transcriptional regulator